MKNLSKRSMILVAIVLALGASIATFAVLRTGTSTAEVSCKPTASSESHKVMIMDDEVMPGQTTAKLCDSLTITNHDSEARLIAFGAHENHKAYDGVEDKVLRQGDSLTITLDQIGSFHFHDHMHDEVEGYFTVTK